MARLAGYLVALVFAFVAPLLPDNKLWVGLSILLPIGSPLVIEGLTPRQAERTNVSEGGVTE